jgi:serine/threonine protein kinase
VKKLIDSNEYSEQEFTNEVQSIGQIHHRNLVHMIGYCKEGKHRMLVFEFMPGGSLRSVLFNPERRPSWRWRAEAALAIARGLEYLHDGCSAPIIHCDIKPDNILLDDRGVPRITDFGISKLLGSQQVHTTVTHIRGTRGYIAPEWLRSDARVDTKADVYSFGVVLLEMICCRRCQEPVSHSDLPQGEEDDETVTLFGWAAQLVTTQRTELMLHGDADVDTVEDMERVERFTRVALWCIEPNPLLRPTMHQVVQMLETNDLTQLQALPHHPPDCYMESSPLIPQLKMAC